MLTLNDFSPLQGGHFELNVGDQGLLALSLIEANALTPHLSAVRAPFSLVFEGPAQPLLPQATYGMTHPSLGPLDIFLVPVARSPAGIRYEAVFN